MALRTERQSARMSKIKNGGLDQYGAGPFEQQQFGTAGVEAVNIGLYSSLYLFILHFLSFSHDKMFSTVWVSKTNHQYGTGQLIEKRRRYFR